MFLQDAKKQALIAEQQVLIAKLQLLIKYHANFKVQTSRLYHKVTVGETGDLRGLRIRREVSEYFEY